MTKTEQYLLMLGNGNIDSLKNLLQNDVIKSNTMKSFKKYLKDSYHMFDGYFSINGKLFICDNFSGIHINNYKMIEHLTYNKNVLDNDIHKKITSIIDIDNLSYTLVEVNVFDLNKQESIIGHMKVSTEKLKQFAYINGDKNLNLLLPDKTYKPVLIVNKNHADDVIGFILPIRQ